MRTDRRYRQALWIWIAGFFLVLLIHLLWHSLNRLPPVWDMAHHQHMGWILAEAIRSGSFGEIATISDYYPPLFYFVEAVLFLALGKTSWLPFLANLPGLFLLSFFTFQIAWTLFRDSQSAYSGILVLMFPLVAWTSRETLLDVSLSGCVALSLYILLRTRNLESHVWSIAFGVSVGIGLLTKWTFILFLVPAVCLSLFRSSQRLRSSRHLVDAVLVALPLTLWWYLPNLESLHQRYLLTARGADWEMDPVFGSLLWVIYYPRCLTSYYLFLPLTVVLIWGLIFLWRNGRLQSEQARWAMIVAGGGVVLLTLLKTKDPRYVMPVVVPLAVLLASYWTSRPRAILLLTIFTLIQFLAISFPLPGLPDRIGFFGLEKDSDYVGMRQEWVWFQTSYFGVAGPPRQEDWHYSELLERFDVGDVVGFVPDHPFYHLNALSLYADLSERHVEVVRLGISDDWPKTLEKVKWVVGKTGNQGISYITRFNQQVYSALETLRWPLENSWELPDGSRALLWRNPSRSP